MKKRMKKTGFTLVELLTVMSIIAILIGILVPALSSVKRVAKDVSQKAQLHSIVVALDLFQGENGSYPDSTMLPSTNGVPNNAPYTVGAQRLAEALVGRDMLGFDPVTTWDAFDDESNNDIYASLDIKGSTQPQEEASLARRKGPYLNQQNTEAFQIQQLYGNGITAVYDGNETPAPVLTDCFRTKNVIINGKTVMAGSPILYYKANTTVTGVDVFPIDTYTPGVTAYDKFYGYIYSYTDNVELIKLKTIKDNNVKHYYDSSYTDLSTNKTGIRLFYDAIKNPRIVSQPRPYNADTYILISAGYDGIYGTKDDITNFGD